MTRCTFDPVTLRCESCGYQATSLPTFRECRPPPVEPWRPVMVGDLVEKALSSVGLTKARVEKAIPTREPTRETRNRWLDHYYLVFIKIKD